MKKEDPTRIHVVQLLEDDTRSAFLENIATLPDETWHSALVHTADQTIDENLRRSRVIFQTEHPALFHDVFGNIARTLQPLLFSETKQKYAVSTLQLLRYGPGDYFNAHTDVRSGIFDYRRYSLVCYLNSGFQGGATSFPQLGLEFMPNPGSAVLFPSWYIHCGDPVNSGEKIALNFYLVEPKAAPEHEIG